MPRRNRVDPFGDLHAVDVRGLLTGNRGCLVDDEGRLARHHRGRLWIICVTTYRDWKSPLDQPRHWTPLFFLDDAVALAAGHRPCGLCRRSEYRSYQAAVAEGLEHAQPVGASSLNDMLAAERLRPGRGLSRSGDRKLWTSDIGALPDGTVVVGSDRQAVLLRDDKMFRFSFGGWDDPTPRPSRGAVEVLTPPTSVLALDHGYRPLFQESATP